jgi:yecA family protein
LETPSENLHPNEPLTDADLDRLGDFLKSCKGGKAMNVEALDGFFAALIAGPETVMPSEYYQEVFGGEMSDACEFGSFVEPNEILGMMMRYWNDIAGTLNKDEVYVPTQLRRLVEQFKINADGNVNSAAAGSSNKSMAAHASS